jgi:uncharacterized membrane protein YhdT
MDKWLEAAEPAVEVASGVMYVCMPQWLLVILLPILFIGIIVLMVMFFDR